MSQRAYNAEAESRHSGRLENVGLAGQFVRGRGCWLPTWSASASITVER
jgi:hypothetical protein